MELFLVRSVMVILAIVSAFGFLNAFYLRHDGPGGDLGIIAGVLAMVAYSVSRHIQKNG